MKIRFGLRTWLLSFTVACVSIGGTIAWLRAESAEFHHIEAIAQKIEQLGGVVSWQPVKPQWLDTWLTDRELNVLRWPYIVDCTIRHINLRDIHPFGNNPHISEIIELTAELPSVYVLCVFDSDLQDEQIRLLVKEPHILSIIVNASTLGPYLEDMMHLNSEPITMAAKGTIAQQSADYEQQRIKELQRALPNLQVVSAH